MKKDTIVVDILIEDAGLLPTKYYFDNRVKKALKQAIYEDVVVNGSAVPKGAVGISQSVLLFKNRPFAKLKFRVSQWIIKTFTPPVLLILFLIAVNIILTVGVITK